MAWDFCTDPDVQARLDWADRFVAEEIEPVESLLYDVVDVGRPEGAIAVFEQWRQEVKDQQLYAAHLPTEQGGQGFGEVNLALPERGDRPLVLGALRLRDRAGDAGQRPVGRARRVRHGPAEAAVALSAARGQDHDDLLDDRAARRRRPDRVPLSGGPRRRRVGHQRRQVLLVGRGAGRADPPHGRDGSRRERLPGHVDVHRPDERPGVRIFGDLGGREDDDEEYAGSASVTTPTSATRTCGCRQTT